MENKKKFIFPHGGFYAVEDKAQETDFFLEKLKSSSGEEFSFRNEYNYYLSAFLSSSRSITFCLQWGMSSYPGFPEWYREKRKKLQDSKLSKFFVLLRNSNQKTGLSPVVHGGRSDKNGIISYQEFSIPYYKEEFKEIPEMNVTDACRQYFIEILNILADFYMQFDVYVRSSCFFSVSGLEKLGWEIEDLEEFLGFPRGWTDDPNFSNDERVQLLARGNAAIEIMPEIFEKYGVAFPASSPAS